MSCLKLKITWFLIWNRRTPPLHLISPPPPLPLAVSRALPFTFPFSFFSRIWTLALAQSSRRFYCGSHLELCTVSLAVFKGRLLYGHHCRAVQSRVTLFFTCPAMMRSSLSSSFEQEFPSHNLISRFSFLSGLYFSYVHVNWLWAAWLISLYLSHSLFLLLHPNQLQRVSATRFSFVNFNEDDHYLHLISWNSSNLADRIRSWQNHLIFRNISENQKT